MKTALVARQLSKWYGNILGVSDINLEIGPGITGLLGPNGAGKSTFLKLASGQLKPNIGTISLFGEPVFANPAVLRRIGLCPEHDSAYAELSGSRFVAFLAQLSGMPPGEAARAAAAALEQVGLQNDGRRPIRGYSFGMRQRLRLAASIVHDPELLLLDEPLRGIDPLWRVRIIGLIREWQDRGKTIIVSSHILPEIEALTSTIVLIHQGKVFARGDIHHIRGLIDSHPHQVSVACARPRELATAMLAEACVRSADVDPAAGTAVFRTDARDQFFAALTRRIVEARLPVDEIVSPDDNLQAVFDYLIGR